MASHILIILTVAIGVIGAIAISATYGPVTRSRVERFARRQRLAVTPANGNLVIVYLATTRRWRAAGLAVGIAVSLGRSLADNGIGVNFLALFAGWFVGAVIAEARLVRHPTAGRRQASLEPRQRNAYLGWFSRRVLGASVVACLISSAAVTAVLLHDGRTPTPALLLLALALVIAGVVGLTTLRVLRRPQPLAEADVIAADDAVRSRSLHVLAGGGAALVLYCAIGQLSLLGLSFGQTGYQAVVVINAVAALLIPALGWNVATWSWQVRRPPTIGVA